MLEQHQMGFHTTDTFIPALVPLEDVNRLQRLAPEERTRGLALYSPQISLAHFQQYIMREESDWRKRLNADLQTVAILDERSARDQTVRIHYGITSSTIPQAQRSWLVRFDEAFLLVHHICHHHCREVGYINMALEDPTPFTDAHGVYWVRRHLEQLKARQNALLQQREFIRRSQGYVQPPLNTRPDGFF